MYHLTLEQMEESSRNARLASMADQLSQERNVVYSAMSKLICRQQLRPDSCTIYKEDLRIQLQLDLPA